jgi:hypothetical protein
MSQPEFREDVYLAEGYYANTVHADLGGPIEAHRESMPRDALREAAARDELLHEALRREPAYRELEEAMNRESLSREPVNREPAARVAGSRLSGTSLAGTPLPGAANGAGSTAQESYAHRPVPPGRALSTAAVAQAASSAAGRALCRPSAAPDRWQCNGGCEQSIVRAAAFARSSGGPGSGAQPHL